MEKEQRVDLSGYQACKSVRVTCFCICVLFIVVTGYAFFINVPEKLVQVLSFMLVPAVLLVNAPSLNIWVKVDNDKEVENE